MSAIEIRGLRVVRGDKVVLPYLSATVEPQAVTGLVGPSGSGKSTLMRAIVGVGSILLSIALGAATLRRRTA